MLIDGCVRAGVIDTGKELLSEMVAGGVKPNAVTYNTLIRAYAMDDKVDMQVCSCIATELLQVRSFTTGRAADCGHAPYLYAALHQCYTAVLSQET